MRREYIPLVIIVIIGVYLRFSGIATNSFAFTYDIGRDMLALQQIVYQHKIPLIGFTTGMPGIFYGPWWYYLLVLPFALSGGNPQYVAYFIALTGITTIILMYIIGKRISDYWLGIGLATFVSFSPVFIALSNQIWNPNIAPLYIALSLLLILRILEKPSKLLFLLLGILLGLLIDTEIVFGLLLVISYIVALLVIKKKKILIKQATFSALGLFLIFLPRILFDIRHQFLMGKTILGMVTHMGASSAGTSLPLVAKESIFFNLFTGTFVNHSGILGNIVLLIFLSFLFILLKRLQGKERQLFIFSLITIGIFMIGISLFKHDIWDHYLVGIPMFYVLSVGILINALRKYVPYGNSIFIIFLFIFSWISLQPIQFFQSLQKPLFVGDASVYRNQLAVVDFVYHRAHGQKFNEIVYTPPIYDYPYQYLFSWYGSKVYHYIPSKQKEKLFFVIIEPDREHPTLLRAWLKVREHDGKILEEHKKRSGIIIQVREH